MTRTSKLRWALAGCLMIVSLSNNLGCNSRSANEVSGDPGNSETVASLASEAKASGGHADAVLETAGQAAAMSPDPAKAGPAKTGPAKTGPAKTAKSNAAAAESIAPAPNANGGLSGAQALDTAREELFEGWPTPKLALFITGQQHGYIEPCGCTGLTNQKGGLARRHTLANQIMARGWPMLAIDAGNQVRRFGPQPELKFQVTIEGLKTIGYEAIALGVDDLMLSVGELVAATASSGGDASRFVCANTAVLDPSLMPGFHVVQRGGVKVGITAIVGQEWQDKITSDDIIKKSAAEALDEVLPKMKEASCDIYVLLAHATLDESRQLARQYSDFDIVVSAGSLGEPLHQPQPLEGTDVMFVETGIKGMHVGVVGIFDDPEVPLRYQRVPLDSRLADSDKMLQLMASYQQQLETMGFDRLAVRPSPHPSGFTFVGTDKCAECHTEAFAIWEETPHSHGTESLVHPGERSHIPRHFDPECLSCHVTGWNPQPFVPYQSGYLGLEQTPLMKNVGCESCHGPGSAHVAAEEGEIEADDAKLAELRMAMRLPLSKARNHCIECHDLDNSPDFHVDGAFEEFWERVKHYGVE